MLVITMCTLLPCHLALSRELSRSLRKSGTMLGLKAQHHQNLLKRVRPGGREDAMPPSRLHRCVGIGCFLLCNSETRGLLLGWSSYGCVT